MKTIMHLSWWLWNQMFQYALGRSFSVKNDSQLVINAHSLSNAWTKDIKRKCELEFFNITGKISYDMSYDVWFSYSLPSYILFYLKKIFWFLLFRIIQERRIYDIIIDKLWRYSWWFNFHPKILKKTKKDTYFIWFRQSYKYFENIKDTIQKDFQPKEKLDEKNTDFLSQFENETTVSIHIRRWDYTDTYHWFCDLEYYKKAIEYIQEKQPQSIFFIFSNDITWCKDNFGDEWFYYVDWNTWNNSYKDMILMSKCHHNIIANSSFSRWAAYLNEHEGKIVIAPKAWFKVSLDTKDLLPPKWIVF